MARKLTLAAVVLVAGLVASSAISLGGDGARLPAKEESFDLRQGHAVDRASGGLAARTAMTRRGKDNTTLRYFETDVFAITASSRDDFFMRCPKRFKAINGYWGSEGGVFADFLAAGATSLRRWEFGLVNFDDAEVGVYAGIVCMRP